MSCFCGHSASYQQCCQPLHLGLQHATSPEQLMRSRYSAYVVGAYEYVLATYYPAKVAANPAQTLQEIRDFGEQSCFVRLAVLQDSTTNPTLAELAAWSDLSPLPTTVQLDATGYVHFQALLLEEDKVGVLDEISRFVFENGRWFYLDGILQPYKTTKVGRNDDCPCGSGQKFKRCAPGHRQQMNSGQR